MSLIAVVVCYLSYGTSEQSSHYYAESISPSRLTEDPATNLLLTAFSGTAEAKYMSELCCSKCQK